MIYLITAHDREKMISEINKPECLKTVFWDSVLTLTKNKTVLYTEDTFNALHHTPIEDRINICFAKQNRKNKTLPNILINNNFKDIVSSFSGKSEDIYVIGSTRRFIEMFAKDADYIIDYTTEELKSTEFIIFDSINFADYNLLKKQVREKYDIRYFVREKSNFIGY